ncbi:MAG TPA: tetratricopeptide repeat protein [Bryobacteraceae bacterium]|nr:tetratricopeptide repeat protein [Bryobacteraceae bacterium]
MQFHNSSQYSDLNWVGESISEKLKDEFSAHNEIVFGRDSRGEALRRLTLRPGADYTKATLIRLGQTLDADYVCYGTYEATLSTGTTELKDSSIQVNAHVIDLRKLHDGPDSSEAGKLVDLGRIEEHLAWENLRYLDPSRNLPVEQFMNPAKFTRVDAEESYIRGLLSTDQDQQQKWFAQALVLDPKFMNPAYELGKLSLERKEYRRANSWLQRIPADDPRYFDARFKMGLAAYNDADYGAASLYFRDIAKTYPLNEVYNNLGAAEDQMNQPAAVEDFRRALEGDVNDSTYLFNLGNALLKNNQFAEAAKVLQTGVTQNPDDEEARTLLGKAQRHEFTPAGKPPATDRLKTNFDLTAFRQLKAVMQPKSGT